MASVRRIVGRGHRLDLTTPSLSHEVRELWSWSRAGMRPLTVGANVSAPQDVFKTMQPALSRNSTLNIHPIPGFTVTETHYQPGQYQSPHEHQDTRLIVTVRGCFREDWARRRHSCGPDSILLRPAGESHSNRYGADGAVCLGIRFGEEWAEILPDREFAGGSDGSVEMASLARRLYRELRTGDSSSMIGIHCGVLDILERFRGTQTAGGVRRPPQWIESAKELLRSRLKSPPDLLEAARITGVHPAHLSRVFRQFTGMTLGGYLRRERVRYACSLLHQSHYSLAEIAQEAGFYDQAHFSRVFRRQVGLSPKEFRSQYRTQSGGYKSAKCVQDALAGQC